MLISQCREFSRYLQGSPLVESMEVDGPVNQSPQSFASSIYSLPELANTSALGEGSNDCQPGFVPLPPCYGDAFDISLPSAEFLTSELSPPPFDPYASGQYTPAQIEDLELLAASYKTPSNAPTTAKPEDEVAKHKTLFGRRGLLDRDRARRASMLKREPKPNLPHNYHLLFVTLVSALLP